LTIARELLKHRFIRSAGQKEALQELIERREDWEARRGDRFAKPEMYNNETIRTIVDGDDDDPWIFATVRPSSSSASSISESVTEIGTVKRIASPPSVSKLHGRKLIIRLSEELMLIIQMIKIVLSDLVQHQKISWPIHQRKQRVALIIQFALSLALLKLLRKLYEILKNGALLHRSPWQNLLKSLP
jgi:hypothetical protein